MRNAPGPRGEPVDRFSLTTTAIRARSTITIRARCSQNRHTRSLPSWSRSLNKCVFYTMSNATRCVSRTTLGALVVAFAAMLTLAAQAPVASDDTQQPPVASDDAQLAYVAKHAETGDPVAGAIKTLVNEAKWEPGRVGMDWRRLRAFYTRRDYRPAWVDPDNATRVRDALKNAGAEGLSPADYAADAIDPPADADPHRLARYDLLLTNSLLLYAHDVLQGRIAPED